MNHFLDILIKSLEPRDLVANHRLGALVTIRKKIIAFGFNSYKSHPLQKKFGRNEKAICLHAEIDAIKNALKRVKISDLKRATLYVARIKKDGTIGMAKPCTGCQRAIVAFGIKQVIFTE